MIKQTISCLESGQAQAQPQAKAPTPMEVDSTCRRNTNESVEPRLDKFDSTEAFLEIGASIPLLRLYGPGRDFDCSGLDKAMALPKESL